MEPKTIIKSLSTVVNIVKRLVDTVKEAEAKKVAVELRNFIISLQDDLSTMHSEYKKLLKEKDNLENKLMKYKDWEKTKSQYELKEVASSVFVYAPKPDSNLSDPNHWLCTNCFDDDKKSVLQHKRSKYFCPKCKNEITVLSSRKYPLQSFKTR